MQHRPAQPVQPSDHQDVALEVAQVRRIQAYRLDVVGGVSSRAAVA
ncbi:MULTISPECIES: hypothetical protein [unclassified Rhodococcus (in: high G+C Gram-positive bacteria)]|nr:MULTISPECIES: hypothetical protein [unclassified Rhodococcus (in: high G+C Gram-positive bacteria)]MBC2644535.1 hypothetical protein [Rhodococcus sp. 3A]MBC2897776.1 hypothetical protein [Rhodococcus sp. 4CII]